MTSSDGDVEMGMDDGGRESESSLCRWVSRYRDVWGAIM